MVKVKYLFLYSKLLHNSVKQKWFIISHFSAVLRHWAPCSGWFGWVHRIACMKLSKNPRRLHWHAQPHCGAPSCFYLCIWDDNILKSSPCCYRSWLPPGKEWKLAISPLKTQTPRTLFLPLSVGQSKSKGQYRFKKREKQMLFFLAALGLGCCMPAFSSFGEQRPLSNCDMWASHCDGFSCCRALALGCLGFRGCSSLKLWSMSSVVVVHRFNCPAACGIFPGQVLNPCPLHWQGILNH